MEELHNNIQSPDGTSTETKTHGQSCYPQWHKINPPEGLAVNIYFQNHNFKSISVSENLGRESCNASWSLNIDEKPDLATVDFAVFF